MGMKPETRQATLDLVMRSAHSPIYNYVMPGLTSWLISEPSERGCVRLLHSSRNLSINTYVTPHSHRFPFIATVLSGMVFNTKWLHRDDKRTEHDQYQLTEIKYLGKPGEYLSSIRDVGRFEPRMDVYAPGETYSMRADEIHSIGFSRDCYVLFFEGVEESSSSVVLEPFVNGRIPTFLIEKWMFKP